MELRHLRYFVAVADELHFGRAARRLHVAQPALSQQIKQLELELGVLLLERTKRHVALTEPGRLFLTEARRALAQVATAAQVARRAGAGQAGRLRIGYVDLALWGVLPAVIGAYRERHPAVEITLLERVLRQQLTGLRLGDLDIGIGPSPPARAELDTALVSEEPIRIALPAVHPLAAKAAVDLMDLAEEPWVMISARMPSRLRELTLLACAQEGFTPRVTQEARQSDALVALVGAGLGVTFVPASAERIPRAGVAYRPLRALDLHYTLVAMWRRDTVPPTLDSFLATLRALVEPSANTRVS